MDPMLLDIIRELGLGSVSTLILYVVMSRSTEHRKADRDAQLEVLSSKVDANERSLTKHISQHQDFEKTLCHKFDKMYDRLNPLSDSVNRILGYMEAKNDKS